MTLWLFSQVPFKQVPCGSLRWERGLTLSFSKDHRKHLWIGWVVRYTGRMLTSRIPPSHCDGFWGVCNSRHWILIVNSHGLAGFRTDFIFSMLQEHTKKAAERREELLVALICGKKVTFWYPLWLSNLHRLSTVCQLAMQQVFSSCALSLIWLLRPLRDNDKSWGYCWVWVPVESCLHCKVVTQIILSRVFAWVVWY